jgi:hypothetical protein
LQDCLQSLAFCIAELSNLFWRRALLKLTFFCPFIDYQHEARGMPTSLLCW